MRGTCVIRGRWTALALLASIALVPAVAEAQRVEGSFQRTLAVSGQPDIEVVTGSGRIEVRPGPAGRVEVDARIQAHEGWRWQRRSTLSPEERVRRIEANPPIEQSGNVVRIGHIVEEELREGVSISYTLTVPSASSLKSKTGSGSQHIEGVDGAVEASSGSGSLTFRDAGKELRASTGSGSITADRIGGGFHATSGSGSIRATGVTGAITAKTGSGGIDVAQTGKGDVQVSSGSGSVRLRGVRGALRASTASGGLTIEGELSADWRLSASSGTVSIDLPRGQGFELDASTGSGRIDVDFPVTVRGTINRRSLRGSTPGGGPLLHVRTSSGGISIQ
jgi:hypothetical protein